MTFARADWTHPRSTTRSEKLDLGVVHRTQLIVDQRDWAAVQAALDAASVVYHEHGTAFGLVRLTLDEQYEDAMYQQQLVDALQQQFDEAPIRLGRNRLLAHSCMEFDDDAAVAAPKIAPLGGGRRAARAAPAPRSSRPPGTHRPAPPCASASSTPPSPRTRSSTAAAPTGPPNSSSC